MTTPLQPTLEALRAAEQWLMTAAQELNFAHCACEWNDYQRKELIGKQREKLGKATVRILQVKDSLDRIHRKDRME